MKHVGLVSQQPQKAQSTIEIKLDNIIAISESLGIYLFNKFGRGSIG